MKKNIFVIVLFAMSSISADLEELSEELFKNLNFKLDLINKSIDGQDFSNLSQIPGELTKQINELKAFIVNNPETMFQNKAQLDKINRTIIESNIKIRSLATQISTLMRQSGPKTDLDETYKINFKKFPNIDPKKIYEFIGLKSQNAEKISLQEIESAISDCIMDKNLKRQIKYIFSSNQSKQQYDNYLKEKDLVSVNIDLFPILENLLSDKAELENLSLEIAGYLSNNTCKISFCVIL